MAFQAPSPTANNIFTKSSPGDISENPQASPQRQRRTPRSPRSANAQSIAPRARSARNRKRGMSGRPTRQQNASCHLRKSVCVTWQSKGGRSLSKNESQNRKNVRPSPLSATQTIRRRERRPYPRHGNRLSGSGRPRQSSAQPPRRSATPTIRRRQHRPCLHHRNKCAGRLSRSEGAADRTKATPCPRAGQLPRPYAGGNTNATDTVGAVTPRGYQYATGYAERVPATRDSRGTAICSNHR